MTMSCRLRHWSRRLTSADNVIQKKYRARLLARFTTSSLVCKPRGRKILLKFSNPCCIWCCEPAESRAVDWFTILSSHWMTSSTDDSSNSACIATTTETRAPSYDVTTHDSNADFIVNCRETNLWKHTCWILVENHSQTSLNHHPRHPGFVPLTSPTTCYNNLVHRAWPEAATTSGTPR